MVESVARLMHQHVGEGGGIVAGVAGHDHAAIAALVADAEGGGERRFHKPTLEGGEIGLLFKHKHQTFSPPHWFPPRDAVEIAQGIVHGIKRGLKWGQPPGWHVGGDEKFMRAGELQGGNDLPHTRHKCLQFGHLRRMLLRREPWPRGHAMGLHASQRGLLLLPVALAEPPHSRWRAAGIGLVERGPGGDDLHDPPRRHIHDTGLPLGPQTQGRYLTAPLQDLLQHRTHKAIAVGDFHQIDRLPDMGLEPLGQPRQGPLSPGSPSLGETSIGNQLAGIVATAEYEYHQHDQAPAPHSGSAHVRPSRRSCVLETSTRNSSSGTHRRIARRGCGRGSVAGSI